MEIFKDLKIFANNISLLWSIGMEMKFFVHIHILISGTERKHILFIYKFVRKLLVGYASEENTGYIYSNYLLSNIFFGNLR